MNEIEKLRGLLTRCDEYLAAKGVIYAAKLRREIRAALSQQAEPAPAQDEREAPKVVAVLYKSGDVLTAEDCGSALEVCAKVETPLMTVDQHERIVAALTRPAQTEQQPEQSGLVEALEYYADGDHLLLADPDAWDTCSGEADNFLHDEAGTASVEDGSIARVALETYRAAMSAQGESHE